MIRALLALTAASAAALIVAAPSWAAFTFAGAWGSQGSGAGQFQSPDGVAVDGAGFVYVADTGNARIQRFTPDGAPVTQWGSLGGAEGQFNSPADVAVSPNGSVYVADTNNHRIQRFTADGAQIPPTWGTPGSLDGQFSGPIGVAAAPDGSIYVADQGNNRVQQFLEDGTFINKFGGPGSGPGQFSVMRGIAVAGDGTVFVVDAGNTRVQAFAPDGTFLTAWGTSGTGDGQFTSSVRGIAASASGVYVADPGSASVQRFTTGGTFLERLSAVTSGDGLFTSPQRAAATGAGQLYVSQGAARMGSYTQQSEGPPGFDTLPPPETGTSANAAPVSGTVRVKRPGSNSFEDFDRAAQIPIGSLVDVRRGEILLKTTSGPSGTQTARFFEGIFRLLQKRSAAPVTDLRLEGGNFKRACRRFRVQPPPRTALAARKRVRRLWGNGTGRFRTKGRYSAAALRGTEWLTEDHCDGTLIRVRSGSVTVRDFVKRRNIVLTAGKSYFARAKPRRRR